MVLEEEAMKDPEMGYLVLLVMETKDERDQIEFPFLVGDCGFDAIQRQIAVWL